MNPFSIDVVNWFFYFSLGFIGIWLPTKRTVNVVDGNYLAVIPLSLMASASLYFFTYAVAEKNYSFMFFNALGSALAVNRVAYGRYKKNKKYMKNEEK